jgi:hypothetical protein
MWIVWIVYLISMFDVRDWYLLHVGVRQGLPTGRAVNFHHHIELAGVLFLLTFFKYKAVASFLIGCVPIHRTIDDNRFGTLFCIEKLIKLVSTITL